MIECTCTFAQRLVGDGCEVCNPSKALEYANEAIAELVQALKDIHGHPNCRHEVEAQLGQETWDVITKYDTTTKETK